MVDRLLSSVPDAPLPTAPAQLRWAQRVALGARVRNARLTASMSPAELAYGLTSYAYLSRIEAGERRPSPALLAELARRLGTDPDDLTRGQSPAADGLRSELAHADLLIGSGHFDDAAQVSEDLAEVAACIGSVETANAALVVRASALAAVGQSHAGLRILRPLLDGPMGLVATVAAARIHLALGEYEDTIELWHRASVQIAGPDVLSAPAAAELATTVCSAYLALGRQRAAHRVARLALRLLPEDSSDAAADQPLTGTTSITEFRSFDQVSRRTERAVATLQHARLRADIDQLCDLLGRGRDRTGGSHPSTSRLAAE